MGMRETKEEYERSMPLLLNTHKNEINPFITPSLWTTGWKKGVIGRKWNCKRKVFRFTQQHFKRLIGNRSTLILLLLPFSFPLQNSTPVRLEDHSVMSYVYLGEHPILALKVGKIAVFYSFITYMLTTVARQI